MKFQSYERYKMFCYKRNLSPLDENIVKNNGLFVEVPNDLIKVDHTLKEKSVKDVKDINHKGRTLYQNVNQKTLKNSFVFLSDDSDFITKKSLQKAKKKLGMEDVKSLDFIFKLLESDKIDKETFLNIFKSNQKFK